MKLYKYLLIGGLSLSLGLSSCVGDLDLENIDPNYTTADQKGFLESALLGCYTVMAVSGQDGPASSIISGLDNGTGQYTRALFMMNEYTTDEGLWIWKDAGVVDLCTNTFDATNTNIQGAYSRLYAHIGVCNQFLYDASSKSDNPDVALMCAEVRALRAMSYYWALELWGNPSFVLEPNTPEPPQTTAAELYTWLEKELTDLVDNKLLAETPVYGRVGIDGAEALLARLYLNAEALTGNSAWDKCAQRCENIINRHKGGGFQGSGLANDYLYLFSRNNEEYMPGGANKAENEILWGLAYDAANTQTYGGTSFLLSAVIANGMPYDNYGCGAPWQCLKARQQFTERFLAEPNDRRMGMWFTDGHTVESSEFQDWNSGYIAIKWVGMNHTANGKFEAPKEKTTFADNDFAFIRLSDVYLMYSECALHGSGDKAKGLEYVNLVRARAGVSAWTNAEYNIPNLMDERSRELYYEMTRRIDLIRNGMYVGNDQMLWSWKGNSADGVTISDRYRWMPLPSAVLNAQPYFKQNPGY